MRTVSQDVSNFLDTNTEGVIAHLVTITLNGGYVERLTTFESPITINGVTWNAGATARYPAIELGSRKESVGTEIGSLDITLYCGADSEINGKRLTLAALDGDFAGAWVKVERAFLSSPTSVIGTMHLFEGPLSEVSPSSTRVAITVQSGMALLTKHMPRVVYQAGCVNTLFDIQCGARRDAWTRSGTVASGSTATQVMTDLSGLTLNYFQLGTITFTSGALAGESRGVRFSSVDNLTVDRPLSQPPAAGDTYTATAGCDKTRLSCSGKFANIARFRATPWVPKNESGRIG